MLRPQTPKKDPTQTFGYAPESNYVFALLISMPPKFYLMLRLKSINFCQNKPKIKLVLQKKLNFSSVGGSASRLPMASARAPRSPNTTPLLTADF